jgi:hypothetical protein
MLRRPSSEQPDFQRFIAYIPGGDEATVELLGAAVLPVVDVAGAPCLLPMRRVVGAVRDDGRRVKAGNVEIVEEPGLANAPRFPRCIWRHVKDDKGVEITRRRW